MPGYKTGAIGRALGFFGNDWFYKTPDLTVTCGKGLSHSDKKVLGQELAGFIQRPVS